MKCPTDGATLVMSERSGIEIDYCPDCRGVWLDRGELDKIIDRAGATAAPVAPAPAGLASAPQIPDQYGYQEPRNDRGYGQGYGQPYGRKKRENWLSDLFD